jgi:hypothetical protein
MCRTALHCTAQQTRLGHWGAYINWACCSDRLRRPGVLCIDLHSTNADLVLSGGADSTAVIYNRATKKVPSEQALAASQTGSMRVGRRWQCAMQAGVGYAERPLEEGLGGPVPPDRGHRADVLVRQDRQGLEAIGQSAGRPSPVGRRVCLTLLGVSRRFDLCGSRLRMRAVPCTLPGDYQIYRRSRVRRRSSGSDRWLGRQL